MNNDAGARPCMCPRPTWDARVVLQEPGEERKMPVEKVKSKWRRSERENTPHLVWRKRSP